MPKIQVPETAQAKNPEGTPLPEFTFADFIGKQVVYDPTFLEGARALKAGVEICALFDGAQVGAVIELSDDQYRRLTAVVESPKGGYGPAMYSYMSYISAVLTPVEK